MSRSRRKTPIVGLTTSESEKEDKRLANRRARHAHKRAVYSAVRAVEADGIISLARAHHPTSGRWTFAKDGKQWIGNRRPKLLRK
jgi:hypothetical protein